ncbi:MAG: SRPBCC family protein [Solirubrobacterales bacterium]|nr:SRPBCC family protein [Solirubrobacterales bacterium]
MIIENEFRVGAEVETVWRELLDMEGVASCLPGATIQATDTENVYDGSMRLKVGPMRVEYRGTATLSEVDEATHTAVIVLSAREAKGQGSAMATIRNQLESLDGGTRVSALTELQITGPQAQFGRGVIEDVGKRVLGEFSRCLEQRIAKPPDGGAGMAGVAGVGGGQAGGADGAQVGVGGVAGGPGAEAGALAGAGGVGGGVGAGGPPRAAAPVADELDVGALVAGMPAVRYAGAALLGVIVGWLVGRRRR